jgi:hypothetical protein
MVAGGGRDAAGDDAPFSEEGSQRNRTGSDSGRVSRAVTAGQPETAEAGDCDSSGPDQPNEYLIHGHLAHGIAALPSAKGTHP